MSLQVLNSEEYKSSRGYKEVVIFWNHAIWFILRDNSCVSNFLKFCAGNWLTAGLNWSFCAWLTFSALSSVLCSILLPTCWLQTGNTNPRYTHTHTLRSTNKLAFCGMQKGAESRKPIESLCAQIKWTPILATTFYSPFSEGAYFQTRKVIPVASQPTTNLTLWQKNNIKLRSLPLWRLKLRSRLVVYVLACSHIEHFRFSQFVQVTMIAKLHNWMIVKTNLTRLIAPAKKLIFFPF